MNPLPISDISAYEMGGAIRDLKGSAVDLAVDALGTKISFVEKVALNTNPELVPAFKCHKNDQSFLMAQEKLSFKKFLGDSLANADRTIADDIMLAALQIYHHSQGAPVVFLGRSPCLIQVAYEELLQKMGVNTASVYHLSFSGTPDVESFRTASEFQAQKKNILRNMVKPDTLEFFERLMTEKGFDQIKGKIYLVDMIGSGGSLSSFLRLFRHYYTQNLKTQIQDVEFLGMNLHFSALGGYEKVWEYSHKESILTFSEDSTRGICPFVNGSAKLHH